MYTSYQTAWITVPLRLIIQEEKIVGEGDEFSFI